MAKKRALLAVEGNIQRAGFRDFVVEKAMEFNLFGRVKNLENQKVEIVCEGEESAIKNFIKEINVKSYPINVKKIALKMSSPKNEFNSFEIVRGKADEELSERADEAVKYMRLSFGKMSSMDNKLGLVDNKLDSVDNKMGSLDKKMGSLNKKTSSMNNKMGSVDKKTGLVYKETKGLRNETKSSFSSMNQKYGSISREMAEFKSVVVDLSKTLKKDRAGMTLLTKTMVKGINTLAKAR